MLAQDRFAARQQRKAAADRLKRFSRTRYWDGYLANTSVAAMLVAWGALHQPARSWVGWVSTIVGAALLQSVGESLEHRLLFHELPTVLRRGHLLHHRAPRAAIGPPWYSAGLVILAIYGALSLLFGAGVGVE